MREAAEVELDTWRVYLNEIKQWNVVKEHLGIFYPNVVSLEISFEAEYDDEGSYDLSMSDPIMTDKDGETIDSYDYYDSELDDESAMKIINNNNLEVKYKRSYNRTPTEFIIEHESLERSIIFPGTVGEYDTYKFNLNAPPKKPNFLLFVEE